MHDRVHPGARAVPSRPARAPGEAAARLVAHYGLVLVFGWIGFMKFTAYEAEAIRPLVASSPILSWLHGLAGAQGASNLIGVYEIAAAVLLALRPLSPAAGAAGAAMAAAALAVTLTFLVTAPGWEPSLGGFPFLSIVPGEFLLKDIVLLGVALAALADAMRAIGRSRTRVPDLRVNPNP